MSKAKKAVKVKKRKSSLATKLIIPIVAIFISLLLVMYGSQKQVGRVQNNLDTLKSVTAETLIVAEDLRADVLYTQQLYMAMSLNRTDDKLEEAQRVREDVASNIEIVKQLDAEFASSWDEVYTQYDNFCIKCDEMVAAYKISSANRKNLMEEVTTLCDELCERMNSCVTNMENALSAKIDIVIQSVRLLSIIALGGSIMCLVLAIVILMIAYIQLLRPIKKVSVSLNAIAEKDLTVADLALKRTDEIGELNNSHNALRAAFRKIMTYLDDATVRLEDASSSMSTQSDTISKNVHEITDAINGIAVNAGEQAAGIQDTVKEIDNLQGIAVKNVETADNLTKASDEISVASKAGTEAVNGLYNVTMESEGAFNEIFESIEKIKVSTGKIGDASNMIESIASQTNLLSLNASIEAARAGEMGKGFAVVADEIRKLSEESARSVNEINEMLKELQANVEIATQRSDNVRTAVEKQVQGVEDTKSRYDVIINNLDIIDDEIKGLGIVSKSMTESCNNVSVVMDKLSASAEDNAAATEETNAAIEEVLAMIQEIAQESETVKDMSYELRDNVKLYKL